MSQVRVTFPILTKDKVIRALKEARPDLEKKLHVSRIVLYGSYAQGRYTAGSDIDVIVVYRGAERGDAYKLVVEEIDLPRLEPKVYTEEQFRLLMTRSLKFAETIQKEGIVI
jgi:predicted nucleotidyltransferase